MGDYLYAGTAQFIPGRGTGPGALFRRAFSEESWQKLKLPADVEVRGVSVHPDQANVLYAGTQYGIHMSEDCGDTWRHLPVGGGDATVWSIVFHPADPTIMYAGTGPAGVCRSHNGGRSWKQLPTLTPAGAVEMGFPNRVTRIAINPADADEIYAGIEVAGVIRSTDAGESWQDCSGDLLRLAEQDHLKSAIGSDSQAEGMVDCHAMAVSKGRVFLANRMGLFQSTDKGETWTDLEIGRFSPLTYARDVRVAPHDASTLLGAFSGAAFSDAGSVCISQDLGQSWRRFDQGVEVKGTAMIIAASSDAPSRVSFATRGGQVFTTSDAGESWSEHSLPDDSQDVYTLAC